MKFFSLNNNNSNVYFNNGFVIYRWKTSLRVLFTEDKDITFQSLSPTFQGWSNSELMKNFVSRYHVSIELHWFSRNRPIEERYHLHTCFQDKCVSDGVGIKSLAVIPYWSVERVELLPYAEV